MGVMALESWSDIHGKCFSSRERRATQTKTLFGSMSGFVIVLCLAQRDSVISRLNSRCPASVGGGGVTTLGGRGVRYREGLHLE